jgi:hypothetical protein
MPADDVQIPRRIGADPLWVPDAQRACLDPTKLDFQVRVIAGDGSLIVVRDVKEFVLSVPRDAGRLAVLARPVPPVDVLPAKVDFKHVRAGELRLLVDFGVGKKEMARRRMISDIGGIGTGNDLWIGIPGFKTIHLEHGSRRHKAWFEGFESPPLPLPSPAGAPARVLRDPIT